jgi:rhamnogalacturonan endolyase
VATRDGHVYVGWRLLASDPSDIAFNVFRSAEREGPRTKLNAEPITDSCNFVDTTAEGRSWHYVVQAVGGNGAVAASESVRSDPEDAQRGYLSIPLQGDYGASKVAIADLDGDGVYDFIIKQPAVSIDPGSPRRSRDTYKIETYNGRTGRFMWRYDLGWNINTGIWFSPMVVYDLDGDGRAEVILKTAPYAATPEEAFISDNGFVLDGPEYCTVLDGLTGKEVTRVDWIARGNVADWGDRTGNRVNRNLLGIAYLDGIRPSVLVVRGTYTRMRVDAYNYIDKQLQKVWSWDGDQETPRIRGQGGHTVRAFDVDGDGRDEVILGSVCLNHDGTVLWNLGMGHPNWFYLADVDPSRPGLEIAYGYEDRQPRNGICLVDPRTGTIIWGCDHPTTHIHDWGMVADIDPNSPGMEIYGMERDGRTSYLYSAQGKLLAKNEDLGSHGPRAFYWLDGPTKVRVPFSYRGRTFPILKYKHEKIGEIRGQIVGLADILGDWREELVTVSDGEIRIYTTTIPATSRRICLMQDPLYRLDVATQSMGYFYPPQLSMPGDMW